MISPRLSRENIVAVAIEMADEEGLASVTLRGIAARLAVHVTSLYNHVPTKDAVRGRDGQCIDRRGAAADRPHRLGGLGAPVRRRHARAGAQAPRRLRGLPPRRRPRASGPPSRFESGFAAFRAAGFDASLDLQRGQGDGRRRARLRARGHAAGAQQERRPDRYPRAADRAVPAGPCDEPRGRQDRHLCLPGRGAHRRDRGIEEGPGAAASRYQIDRFGPVRPA